jgi:hypothetical protein
VRVLLFLLVAGVASAQGYEPRAASTAGKATSVAALPSCASVNAGRSYLLTTTSTFYLCDGTDMLQVLTTADGQAVNADEDITPRGVTAQAGSGEYALRITHKGAKVSFGPVTSAECTLGADNIVACGIFAFAQLGADQFNAKTLDGRPVVVVGGVKLGRQALGTCGSATAPEDTFRNDSTGGGTTTGKTSKPCVCTSDGAASPTYQWRNLLNPSDVTGNTTTCPDSL